MLLFLLRKFVAVLFETKSPRMVQGHLEFTTHNLHQSPDEPVSVSQRLWSQPYAAVLNRTLLLMVFGKYENAGRNFFPLKIFLNGTREPFHVSPERPAGRIAMPARLSMLSV